MNLPPDGPEAHLLGCPNFGRFLSRHPQGSQPVAGPSGLRFAATASPPSRLTVRGLEVSPDAVAASPFMSLKPQRALGLFGLAWLLVVVVQMARLSLSWVLLGLLLVAALSALLGCLLWIMLGDSDRTQMGVARRGDYESHGSE